MMSKKRLDIDGKPPIAVSVNLKQLLALLF
jgi:hypothetical protein